MSEPLAEIDLALASSELLQGMGDVLEVGIITLGRDLVVLGCNRWLATAIGGAPADYIGRPVFDVFPGLAETPAADAFRGALGGSTIVWSHQFHGYLLPVPALIGSEPFPMMQQSARIIPIVRDGQVEGVLAIVQDVTERVSRERALKQALRAAEVASQAKSDFLASMSHELRTPLSAIIGYMDLLVGEMVGPVPPLQKSYMGRVGAAARHLISIIEEILTFSRVEAGREPVHIEEVDVATLLRDACELLEPQAKQKSIELSRSIPAEQISLRTDVTKLRQIVINLLGNAVKFTDAGRVTLELETKDGRLLVHVRDTGPGIVMSDAERIFDPFTQVDQSLRRTKGGTGLGLPVSRRLAHLLDGDLTVESVVGEGTTFTLWLPLAPT